MNKLTGQIQTVTQGTAYDAWARAVKPKALKVIVGGIDMNLLMWLADHGLELVVLREAHTEDGDTREAAQRVTDILPDAEQLRPLMAKGVRVAVEFPFNEEDQTDPDAIGRLSDVTITEGQRILDAGFDLVIGIFSEGNPRELAWWGRFHAALRWGRKQWARGRRVFLGLHEYATPNIGGPFDGWHEGRYRKVWAILPDDCKIPILLVEGGVDGGTENPPRKEQGWRSFFASARAYLPYMRKRRAEFAKDAYVWWVFDFVIGSFKQWAKFDLGDEVDLRPAYLEDEPGPDRWVPEPIHAPPQEVPVRFGLLYRMGADVPEKNVDELAALCKEGGFAAICPKAMDGTSWEGSFDGDPVLALKNRDVLLAQRDAYGAHGLAYEPWVVYRGIDAEAEAEAHATIARLCGTVIVDFEWMYAQFADHGDFGDAIAYFANLRAKAPRAQIVFCPDPRQLRDDVPDQNGTHPAAYDVAAIAPYVNWSSDQVYWTDFKRGVRDVLDESRGDDHAGLPVVPMMPGNATPDELDDAITYSMNVSGSAAPRTIYVFQRVGLRPENLPVIAKHAALWTAPVSEQPQEPAQEDDVIQLSDADKAAVQAANDALWGAAETYQKVLSKYGSRGTSLGEWNSQIAKGAVVNVKDACGLNAA